MKELLPNACRKGTHNFTVVHSSAVLNILSTVKWCKDCGAIVVLNERTPINRKPRLISIFNRISLIKVK
jgi:hypothetical protein